MLGVSFTELGLIMAVALVVLGPARLPGLVRKVGRWIGKARTMAREFQHQLESEISLDELNRMTEARSKESKESPAKEPAADAAAPDPAQGGYPYGPQEPVPEPDAPPAAGTDDVAADATPQSSDDTFSHAHAPGDPPVAGEPAPESPDQKPGGAA